MSDELFLTQLEAVIKQRIRTPSAASYTSQLAAAGTKRIAQKVGEEAVEVALAATAGDRDEFVNETADLLYHLLVLLADQDVSLADIDGALAARHAGQ